MNAITVYTTTSCMGCRITKRTLDQAGIEYQTIDASTEENIPLADAIKARADELSVMATMPYVTIYDPHNELVADWFGLQPDQIKEHILAVNK